jgi:hypothetical protein
MLVKYSKAFCAKTFIVALEPILPQHLLGTRTVSGNPANPLTVHDNKGAHTVGTMVEVV